MHAATQTVCSVSLIALATFSTSASAQTAEPAATQSQSQLQVTPQQPTLPGTAVPNSTDASQDSNGGLQDIVVTAQKRAENLQAVPIAVTAASGVQLQNSGVTTMLQINTIAPGLNIRTTLGSFQPSIRGIGTSSSVVENPVALYIDGVYLPQQREGLRDLNDIAQIAVLKGPQGTLFGRNATGGVVQISTLAPSHDLHVRGGVDVDNYGTVRTDAYVTGGLSDTVAASLSGQFATQANGWGTDLTNGHDTYKLEHQFAVRSKILFEPTSRTAITLIADYQDRRQLATSFQPYPGTSLSYPGVGPLKSKYDTYSGTDGVLAFKGGGVSLTVDQELGFAKLLSISSYRRGTGYIQFDNSLVAAPVFTVRAPDNPNEDYTQELQLISPKSGNFDWVVGVFYFHNLNGVDPIVRNLSGPLAPLPTSVARNTTNGTEITESVAPFAQASLEFLPGTKLTGGVRYTYEKRTFDGNTQLLLNSGVTRNLPSQGEATIKKPTFRAVLDHKFGKDILGYVSFNTGIKSGGFNIFNPANKSYLPEKLTAYEAGLKSELLGRTLRLNVAGFYYQYKNIQVIQLLSGAQSIVNGAAAKLYGLDVDFEYQPIDNLHFNGGFEVLHSEFTNYPNAVFSTPRPTGGAIVTIGDAAGKRLPLAQKFTATAGMDYDHDLSSGSLHFNMTANYNGDYFFEPDNFLRQKAYVILNSSLKWTLPDRRFSVAVYGKNLFNEIVITQTSTQAQGYPTTYGNAPRTFGVIGRVEF